MSQTSRLARGAILLGCGALLSCGAGNDDRHPPATGDGSAGGPSDGAAIQTDNDASRGTGGVIVSDGSVRGAVGEGSLDDAACAAESRTAERSPLDMYLMLDTSLSMTDFIADGITTKWQAVQRAVTAFVNDTHSSGLGVGLQYFPLLPPGVPLTCFGNTDCGVAGPCALLSACANSTNLVLCQAAADCNGGRCDPLGACRSNPDLFCVPPGPNVFCDPQFTDPCSRVGLCLNRDICDAAAYANAAVEVSTLPAAAASLVSSITARVPDGNTPTSSALSGALDHAKALAVANPGHRLIVVLATDGLPTECAPTAIALIAALASSAAQGNPSIATFVIGVFAPQEQAVAQANLDALAMAGGSNRAFLINTGQDVTTQFLDALNAIRTTALTCEYGIPQPDSGRLDYRAVNVRFTSGTGQTSTIGYAGGAAACAAAGGWYYDVDPVTGAAPTKIEICPTTCASFMADTSGQVNILFGCTTVPIVR